MGFLGLMGYMTIDGYINGDAEYMLAPIMSPEVVCGYDNAYGNATGYPLLFITNLSLAVQTPSKIFSNFGICVESCPSGTG